jgi:Rad3-related DNA helicase
MEAVTIRTYMDEEETQVIYQAQVIHVRDSHRVIEEITLAEKSMGQMKITAMPTHGDPRSIYLTDDAMTALVQLWGGNDYEAATIAELDTANNALHQENARLQVIADDQSAIIASLQQTIKGMRSQESFRTALLESVVSAARVYSQDGNYDLFSDLDAALEALDEWQSDDASTDVGAHENEALRNQLARMQSQESFRTALLESVVSAARDVLKADTYLEDWTALSASLSALDAWQTDDATTDVSAPEARYTPDWQCSVCGGVLRHQPECTAPVAPGVCPECNYGDGAHSADCSEHFINQ